MATDNLMPQSSTSIIKHFMLRSSTTGQGLTGKVHSDFSGKYNIAGGAEVTLSFSSGTAGDAYSSGKIVPLGLGKYAWHVPNAVFASLGNVSAVLSVTGGIDVHFEWLVVADSRDLATKPVNITQLGGDTQSLADLKDFADAGYDPSTNKVQGVVTTDSVASAGMLSIADEVLKRNVSNVEASAGEHTLATAILGMLEWEISGNDLIIKRTDGTTVHYTKTLSSATGTGDVITGLN